MSSTSLPFIQTQITLYGTTTLMVLGCFGNAYVIFLFSKHHKNACAIYLMCAASMNILYLGLSVPYGLYVYVHGDPSLHSMGLCKMRFYLFHVWGQISRYSIAIACIDRFALTNRSAKIRALSQPKIARIVVVITIIFWYVFASHIAIETTIENGRCGYFGLYSTINSIYVLIFNAFIPPITMTTFGYLAFRQMKQMQTRVQPSGTGSANTVIQRKDRNLLTMLLGEVSVYVVTMSLYPAILLEGALTSSMASEKSIRRVQIESFVSFIATFLIYMNTSACFYIYCAVSKTFRDEFKASVRSCWRFLTRQ
jgi:hypothetical protein